MDIVHSGGYQRVVLGRIDTMNPGISKCPEGIEAEAWNHGISISTRGSSWKFICRTAAFEVLHCWGVSTKRCATERKTFTLRLLKCEQRHAKTNKLPICAICIHLSRQQVPSATEDLVEIHGGHCLRNLTNFVWHKCDQNASDGLLDLHHSVVSGRFGAWLHITVMLAETATFETRQTLLCSYASCTFFQKLEKLLQCSDTSSSAISLHLYLRMVRKKCPYSVNWYTL